nr:MAG TPA: hypothetical protein [Caudoviricetes sp.]
MCLKQIQTLNYNPPRSKLVKNILDFNGVGDRKQ